MSLSSILNKPTFLNGIGEVHPIQLKNWDEFESYATVLVQSESHFKTNGDYPLLDILVKGVGDELIIVALERIFQLSLKNDDVKFTSYITGDYEFIVDDDNSITPENYPILRETIMRQNILFEPKVYKNPAMQKWAEKVLQTRSKNAPNVTLEDMLSTVSVMKGKDYWELADYTMYQLKSDFNRICKINEHQTHSLLYANPHVDMSKIKIEHFAEKIEMYTNPYDGIFKEKSAFKNMNNALQ